MSATTLEFAPLQTVHIYFDTATYDEIERDVKVTFPTALNANESTSGEEFYVPILIVLGYNIRVIKAVNGLKGDTGGSTGLDWRHNGSSHWLLHPQWRRDHLLHDQVSFSKYFQSLDSQVLHVSQDAQHRQPKIGKKD